MEITNKTVVNFCIQNTCEHKFSFHLGKYLRVGIRFYRKYNFTGILGQKKEENSVIGNNIQKVDIIASLK